MQRLGMGTGEAIEHPWVTRSIENAQRKVEGRNFDVRKEILAYDDVANDQRKVIYAQRNELMAETDISPIIIAIRKDVLNKVITRYIPPKTMAEQWDIAGLEEDLRSHFNLDMPLVKLLAENKKLGEEGLREQIISRLEQNYQEKEQVLTAAVLRDIEKSVMMQVLDNNWKEHLAAMDYLRQGIHFRGYAQKDPKQEYKRESFEMFSSLLDDLKYEVIGILSKLKVSADPAEQSRESLEEQLPFQALHGFEEDEDDDNEDSDVDAQSVTAEEVDYSVAEASVENTSFDAKPVGRNDPCPCGSGQKFKQCHGKLA
jgi:preprotein translocase subunit SecA